MIVPPLTPEELKTAQLADFRRREDYDTQHALCPVSQTIETLAHDRPLIKNQEVEAKLHEIIHQTAVDRDFKALESILVTNAYDLNNIFHRLLKKASTPEIDKYPDRLKTVIDLALKSQRQMVACVDLLARLKNPPASTVIQQNIAQNQQINNGMPAAAKTTNELLLNGSYDHATLDTGGTAAPARPDPELATVAAVDRAEDG